AGMKWKAGQTFFVHMHAIQLNPKHWPEPEKFDPDRFMKNSIEKNSFIPFGGGVRMCPGRHLGELGIKTLMASVFRKFDVSLVDPDAPLHKGYGRAYSGISMFAYDTAWLAMIPNKAYKESAVTDESMTSI
ncbi:11683_t:CDS:2, partial [Diversispora eburnea]